MLDRFPSLLVLAILAATTPKTASADPSKAVEAFLSACLRSDVSLKTSVPAVKGSGVRSASMNEGLFDLDNETVKGTVYEVDPSMVNSNRPYVVGCNVVAEGRFSSSAASAVEAQLDSLGFSKVKGRPKAGKIQGAKGAIFAVYENGGRTFDIYVGDIAFDDIGKRTFLILGVRP